MKKRLLTALVLTLAALVPLSAQVPGIINYHGILESNGNKYKGTGEFKFALVDDSEPANTFWSNDGTLDGTEPADFVEVEVDDGMFTVALGDTSLPNMLVIPTTVFTHPNVFLRVWFNDGQNGFALLTPDQRMTSSPYAMMAANVPDGIITADKLEDGLITTGKLADGAVTTPKLADDAVTADKIALGAVGTDEIANNSVTSADIANTLTLERLNLGGVSWDGSLNLYSKPNGGGGFQNNSGAWRGFMDADEFGSELDLFMGNGTTGAVLSARSPGGRLRLADGLGTTTALMGTTLGGGDLNLYQISGALGIKLDGDRASFNQASAGGEISVHTAGGQVGLLLDGNHSNAGRIEVRQAGDPTPFVDIFGRGSNDGGEIWLKDDNGTRTIKLDGNGGEASLASDGLLQLGVTGGANLVFDRNEITARDGGAEAPLFLNPNQGNVVVGRTSELSPTSRLLVQSDPGQDALRVRVSGSTKLYVSGDGGVGINTTNLASNYELSVNGQVICEELVVQNSSDWPDYVFKDDYNLMPLNELEASIEKNGHLPGIPKADVVEQDGISIGEMQRQMMEKIEELTLYVLQQNKRLTAQQSEIQELRAELRR